ncbi:tetratricopeptide repeat protein [Streptomyces sp. S.PB5]|uniref:tetratricopeptide repeat protein n=1 Tax=Streptomyces sp. S.PB5 TaxID=3020844 RepID=UPI0025B21741|nr:tetratricopeptide repeat protein [Streptomyces sp. S.PB5]MDN3022533.1 tetratricopeptide repeat protein [Streptomyces sp. S.PB5]
MENQSATEPVVEDQSATENFEEAAPRRSRTGQRLLAAAVTGCLVLGGTLMVLPWRPPAPRAPAPPAPGAQAQAALTVGAPAALPDLAVLISERETHLRRHPRDAESWAVLGAAYVEQGRRTAESAYYPKAGDALRTSLKVRAKGEPVSVAALGGLAALANARRDFRTAKRYGEAALKLEPKRWTTYPLLIDAYTGLGDWKATGRTLERLQELHGGPAVLARAGGVYRDRGWREDAMAQLSDAAAGARAPAERAAYLERVGQLAWERGEREVALRHFREAVRIDPDQRAAQAGQGRALAALGRTSQALSAYRVALTNQPDPQYALELGELYESLGLRQTAGVQYELVRARVRHAESGGVDGRLVLGQLEADHGSPETAVRLLREEWRRQPGIAVADALGWALHRAGEDEEALRFAVRATDKVHGGGVRSALYAYHRGMIERELGLNGPARRHLQEALRINPYFSRLHVPSAQRALTALGEPSADDVPVMDAKPTRG